MAALLIADRCQSFARIVPGDSGARVIRRRECVRLVRAPGTGDRSRAPKTPWPGGGHGLGGTAGKRVRISCEWIGEFGADAKRMLFVRGTRRGVAVTAVATATMRTAEPETGHEVRVLPVIEDPARVAPRDARALSRQFFERLAVLEEGTAEYQYARNTLIEMNMSLVRFAARRFRNFADEMEDVVQVGMIGLIKAIDRFELSRETEFATFAVPYIVGEMKRFFRDTTWAVHVPRRLQERRSELARAREELESRLDRSPTVKELAALMDLSEDEVVEAQMAANGYNSASLDAALSGDEESGEAALADFIGAEDPAMDLVENFQSLAPLMAELSDRERLLLQLRFGEELTQSQIGEELGVSQMQVSRLLSRTVAKLRAGMFETATGATA
ncbi:hypothetical protein GCM10010326_06230 [Streptomyces xanthochromogenes]|uniref:RNA polymerase sigma-70 domain-containing protein n=2 Tax=Streptomyces TaxID=1883 RepID=A0ABQ2ZKS3_9ACTN|nr:hypothetical protein GCM10010326_06230 [Streptomyces xanthochromogenes]